MSRLCLLIAMGSLFVLLPQIAISQQGNSPTTSSNPGDYAKPEEDHKNLGGWKHHDLHDQPRLPDGSKGYSIPLSTEGNLGYAASDLPPFQDFAEYSLHGMACDTDAIVVATLVGSEPHLSSDKSTIFTRYHFHVDSLIKSAPGAAVGGEIGVIHLGGSVVDAGEKLTVIVTGAVPFETQKTYLLTLYHDGRASANVFQSPQLINLRVISGNIVATPGSYRPAYIRDGESIESFKQRLQSAMEKAPCR
jgi:hypothetical protein